MKRIPIYIILVILTFLAPVQRVDVGQLEPVEAVFVLRQGDTVTVMTDTGNSGQGTSALAAMRDMMEKTSAVIYLDTAHYLIMTENAQADAEQLRKQVKSTVGVCYMEGQLDVKEAVQYLDVHGKLPSIKEWKPGQSLPVLTPEKIFQKK